jgi:hypothetical protein
MRCAVVIVAIVTLAGCGNKTGGGDGGAGGGGGGDMTMTSSPDLLPRSIAGIACGADTCTTTAQLCCTGDNGATGDCQYLQQQSCGKSEFLCDGPEDCEPANPVCCVENGQAQCVQNGTCGGKIMCHTSATDCTPPLLCHAAPNSPYSLCL